MLVIDLGGQYSQLIARRVRECRVYSELVGHTISPEAVRARNPYALILSGGPASVYADDAPRVDPRIFELGIPTLGICYGMQLMALDLGGRVDRTGVSEFGKTELQRRGVGAAEGHAGRADGLDVASRLRRRAARRRARRRRLAVDADRRVRGARARAVRRAVPSRGRAHAARDERAEELPLRDRRRAARVDAGRGDRGAGRAHPRAGRHASACSARSRAASTPRSRRCSCTRRSATS